MPEFANADQNAYWNSEAGERWVTREADLDSLHAAVIEILLEDGDPKPGEDILDIGCGAGATTLAFAAAVGPAGRVLGVDISEALLGRAEVRCRAAGLGNVAFLYGDAQSDALPEGRFDAAVSRFGVMFFADPVAAFRNIASALRPGGRMLFATWAAPAQNPWFSLPVRLVVERLGPAEPQPPDAPGPMAFADRDRVVGLLQAAGLSDCGAEARGIELHHPGGVAGVAGLATEIGPGVRLLREKNGTEEDRSAITSALTEALARYETPDGIRIPAEINLFRARRP